MLMENLSQAVRVAIKSWDMDSECVINVGVAWGMQINILVNLQENDKHKLIPDDGLRVQFVGLKDNGSVSKYYGARRISLGRPYYDAERLIVDQLNMKARRSKFLKTWLQEETEAATRAAFAI